MARTIKYIAVFAAGVMTACFVICCNDAISASSTFREVRLIEILQLVSAVIVAVYISVVLKQKLGERSQQKQLLITQLDSLRDLIRDAYIQGVRYMDKPQCDEDTQVGILSKHKQISMFVYFLLQVEAKDGSLSFEFPLNDSLKDNIITFKGCLTADPFGQRSGQYDAAQKGNFLKLYELLLEDLELAKLKLFAV